MGKFLGFTISLLLLRAILPADPLSEARKAEQKGDVEGAFIGYTKWVESQTDLDKNVETLFRAIDGIPDLERSMKLLDHSLNKLKDPVNRSRMLALKASLLERMGAFEPAEQAYGEAYEIHPVPSSLPYLVRSACLLFELGDLETSEKRLRFVLGQTEKPEDRWEAQFHLARIFAITQRVADALTVGKRLLDEATTNGKEPQTLLYFLYTVTGAAGMQKEQEIYRTALLKNGGLLKHFIASDEKSKVTPLPLPSLFFSGIAPPTQASVSTPTPVKTTTTTIREEGAGNSAGLSSPTLPSYTASSLQKGGAKSGVEEGKQFPANSGAGSADSSPRPTGIQVGSFSVRDNAEHLAKDLRGFGFPALVKQSQWKDGAFLYRTVVPLRTTPPENPQTVLIKLKEHGFEGFFLFESNGE